MASQKASELPDATTPDGSEFFAAVQGGDDVKMTLAQVSGRIGGLSTADTSAAAAANTTAIQAALNEGGLVQIIAPGTYYISDSLLIASNTEFYLGAGVELRMRGSARNMMRTSNAAWSSLDTHVLDCITIICASGTTGTGTVSYAFSTLGDVSGYADVSATLAYKGPNDTSYGTAASIPANPGGKMRLVSGNGTDILWVAVGNMSRAGAIGDTFLPVADQTERVNIVDNGAVPVSVTWTYSTINALPIIVVHEVGHTRQPGDRVEMLEGSGLEGLFEVYNIGNAVTYGNAGTNTGASSAFKNQNSTVPDYWTIMPNTAVNPSYWGGLAASGSAKVWGLRKIYWRGPGLLNYNKNAFGSLPNDNSGSGVIINGVSDCGIFETRLSNTYGHGWFSTNVAKVRADLGESLGYYGIWNPRGPIRDMEVRGVRGRADDNACDLGTSDYANYIINFPHENCSHGAISGTDVFDVRYCNLAANQSYEVTRLYASNGSQINGWLGESIFGTSDEQADAMMQVLTDDYLIWTGQGGTVSGPGAAANGAVFKDLTFRDFRIKPNPYFKKPSILFRESCTFSLVSIDGIDLSIPAGGGSNGAIYITGQMTTPLRLRNVRHSSGTFRGYVVQSSTTTNAGVDIDGCTLTIDNQASGLLLNTTGASVTTLSVRNAVIADGNYVAASAAVAAGGTGYSNGNVLTVVGGTLSTGGAAAQFTVASVSGGAVTSVTLTTAGAYLSDGKPTNPVTVTGGGGSSCTLNVTWTEGGSKLMLPITNQGNMDVITVDTSSFTNTLAPFYGNSSGAQPIITFANTKVIGATFLLNLNQTAALKGITLINMYGNPYQTVGGSVTAADMRMSGTGFGNWVPGSNAWSLGAGGSILLSAPDMAVDIAGCGAYLSTAFGAIFKSAGATGTLTAGMLVVSNATTGKFVAAHDVTKTS